MPRRALTILNFIFPKCCLGHPGQTVCEYALYVWACVWVWMRSCSLWSLFSLGGVCVAGYYWPDTMKLNSLHFSLLYVIFPEVYIVLVRRVWRLTDWICWWRWELFDFYTGLALKVFMQKVISQFFVNTRDLRRTGESEFMMWDLWNSTSGYSVSLTFWWWGLRLLIADF